MKRFFDHPATLAAAAAATPVLFDSALKGVAVLAAAALVAVALRRASASARHLVWTVSVAALLALPVLSVLLPQWQVVPASLAPSRLLQSPAPAGTETLTDIFWTPASTTPTAAIPATTAASITPAPSGRPWFLTVWIAGSALLALRLAWSRNALRRLSRQARPAAGDSPLATSLEDARQQLQITRSVRLFVGRDDIMPMTWGILRPAVLLPAAATTWSPEKRRAVLLHELAHVRRFDTLTSLASQLACALFWFNPLVWVASWRIGVERENACDDLVLASGVRASDYASHLLEVASGRPHPPQPTPTTALAMAKPSRIEERLRSVLNPGSDRRRVTAKFAAVALGASAAIVFPVAMIHAENDPQPATPDAEPVAAAEVPAPAAPPEPLAPAVPDAPNPIDEFVLDALGAAGLVPADAAAAPAPPQPAPEPIASALDEWIAAATGERNAAYADLDLFITNADAAGTPYSEELRDYYIKRAASGLPVPAPNPDLNTNAFGGIGIAVHSNDGGTFVGQVLDGGPASQTGVIKTGDQITHVAQGGEGAWADISNLPLDAVIKLIRGLPGSQVRLQLRRSGGDSVSEFAVSMPRAQAPFGDQAYAEAVAAYDTAIADYNGDGKPDIFYNSIGTQPSAAVPAEMPEVVATPHLEPDATASVPILGDLPVIGNLFQPGTTAAQPSGDNAAIAEFQPTDTGPASEPVPLQVAPRQVQPSPRPENPAQPTNAAVVYLKRSDASELATKLNTFLESSGRGHVVADPRLNALVVLGDSETAKLVKNIASWLDRPTPKGQPSRPNNSSRQSQPTAPASGF